jgi:multidrug efflux system outer membrane protein
VEQTQANLQAQLRARAQAVNALVLLIGEPLPEDLPQGLPLDGQALLADIPAGFRRTCLPGARTSCRPRVAACGEREHRRGASGIFPKISLTAAFGTESLSLGGLFKAGSTAWSFVPQITLPIFEGGANIANLQLANVEKRIEIASYEKSIQSAFREVADGLAARGTYDQQIAALERNTLRTSARSRFRTALPDGRGQLPASAHGANQPIHIAADADQRAACAADQPRRSIPRAGRRLDRACGRNAASGGCTG